VPLSKLATSKSNRQSSLCLQICRASADPSPRSSSDPRTFRLNDDTRQGSQDIKHFQRNPLLRLPLLRLPSSTASLNPSHPILPTSRNMSLLQRLLQTIPVPPIRPRKKSRDSRQNLPSHPLAILFSLSTRSHIPDPPLL